MLNELQKAERLRARSNKVSAMLEDLRAVLEKHKMCMHDGIGDGMCISTADDDGVTLAYAYYLSQDICTVELNDLDLED
jgi:hypothetical protein